jgi:hypothetical protein
MSASLAFRSVLVDGRRRRIARAARRSTAGRGRLLRHESLENRYCLSGSGLWSGIDLAVGAAPGGLAAGDLNGDGCADIVSSNGSSNDVSVLLGQGDGTFAPAASYAVGASPTHVAIADLDADGVADLAVTNSQSHTASILIGVGDGSFLPAQTFATGGNPQRVVVADVTGDAALDLMIVISNYPSSHGSVNVFSGLGDGSFVAAASYSVGAYPFDLEAVDLNHDGQLDLAVANTYAYAYPQNYSVSVLLADGAGGFLPNVEYAAGINPIQIASADFNGEGNIDLAVTNGIGGNPSPTDQDVSIFLGDGAGHVVHSVFLDTGLHGNGIVTADFDGDGRADLAIANQSGHDVSVVYGQGDGTFTGHELIPVGLTPYDLVTADFNGDGAPDLAVTTMFSNAVTVLLNGLAPVNQPPTAADFAVTVTTPAVGIPLLPHAADPDGEALVVSAVTQGQYGTVVMGTDGVATYQLTQFMRGVDSFTYTVTDAAGATATATVAVTIEIPPLAGIEMVRTQVDELGLRPIYQKALTTELCVAQILLEYDCPRGATAALRLFVLNVRTLQKFGKIEALTADLLVEQTQTILSLL